ncbi:FtsQ-type POTRA domain-containing protein [Actinomyces urogenitalis]|uniref:cell division protein FtsQ/DivIB n=1 Tax=Actinomyces urogenitalis TaxID=103621 RepID=UPI002901C171|nr:FtsQ-type POTRA domain-containing protein [Actinomyces urogenitalis]MDU0864508.1 FtsQ-type POTRA domain-containing protein [Actinomyces urogenitalis]MDU0875054.1 FtsQ-type POTRA domain-containing protein [Actinomyces urogenitalis]MDU1564549.1 FtsQ-type POTRA domain-containing protein [Actinomyces urogenitalis]MDU1640114.1 FtsQ-type POTRA domain-containing protein [Actinomyces urogenitalis]MDU6777803.1 FtsQ-type POTRA domain-containing protein [Actinomyces urogenitalis]
MRKPSPPRPEPGAEVAGHGEVWRQETSADLSVFARRGERSETGLGQARDRVVSTGLADRLAERRRALRTLRRRRVWMAGAVLILVLALAWTVLWSPLLGLRGSEITVSGSDSSVSTEQVRELLQDQEGTSLVRLDLRQAARTVTDGLVRVRSTQVARSWPHGLTVSLTMRVPVAVRQVDQSYEVLDGDAVVLETTDTPPEGLVRITDPEDGGLSGTQVAAVAQAVGALDVATRAQVASGSASSSGQVTLVLTSGASVQWGDTEEMALKAQVLKVLLAQEASVYDVSSPHSPTTS